MDLSLLMDLWNLDMLGEITGLGEFEHPANHTIEVELFGKMCRVPDIDGLIISKRAIGRPKDNQVIIQLEAIKKALDQS